MTTENMITKHSILRAKQRFKLKDKKVARKMLKEGLDGKGKIIERENQFDFIMEYQKMYLVVKGGMLRTVLTKEQYEYENERHVEIENERKNNKTIK